MARDRREKRIQEGYFEGADVGHGKYSTYAAGCRCDLCAEAQTQYAYTSRLARRSAPEKPYNSECACCHRIRELHLDHDHVTGDFRGWICRTCNTGIGKLGDNIAGLERAIEYLKGN